MAETTALIVNKEFSSKEELELFIRDYSKETNRSFSKYNTRKLKNNELLYYHSLNYLCECAGTYVSRSKDKRNAKSSKKCECPFVIKINLNKEKTKLVISPKSVFDHNEKCDEFFKKSNSVLLKPDEISLKPSLKPSLQPRENEKNIADENIPENIIENTTAIDVNDSKSLENKEIVIETENVTLNTATTDFHEVKSLQNDKIMTKTEEFMVNQTATDQMKSVDTTTENSKELLKKQNDSADSKETTTNVIFNVNDVSELNELQFAEDVKKTRGRPLGSVKTTVCGSMYKPPLQPYNQMSKVKKAKLLLNQLGFQSDTIMNVLEGSYTIPLSDICHMKKDDITDTFLDKEIDPSVLMFYLSKEAYSHIIKTIKKKNKSFFICKICTKEAKCGVVQCSTCLQWLHFICVEVEEKSIKEAEPWFCKGCDELFNVK